jgi:hypothetical protein
MRTGERKHTLDGCLYAPSWRFMLTTCCIDELSPQHAPNQSKVRCQKVGSFRVKWANPRRARHKLGHCNPLVRSPPSRVPPIPSVWLIKVSQVVPSDLQPHAARRGLNRGQGISHTFQNTQRWPVKEPVEYRKRLGTENRQYRTRAGVVLVQVGCRGLEGLEVKM